MFTHIHIYTHTETYTEREREREREMGEGKGSSLVHLLVIVLSLVAFGFAIAAERRRSTGTLHEDKITNQTYCVYHSDVATGYGVGGFLFLLSSESLLMGVTKCMCFGRPLAPGGNRAWTIIYFMASWATFLVAEACLIAGAKSNAYHTKYRNMIYADFSCETLRKGVFIAGAVFVVATMVLNVYYYMYFTKATTQPARKTGSTVGMTGKV
ncbi:hypothetical protein BUALT_Bualt05G0127600 [Buddleja alternifolia]|uniref:Uncharacterized protein n=1 Tax=Buddleja alternifolia TaxID=168488 RepID=A0AAV6XUU9_9LAMI|nr:hypothetical protein BUALT_Bualt05G0127600 [Buddleja alternifolia]